ncbi:unnamed protein product [Owenia fusiformis]|uniref:Uncharacterized protein n=1 Tax=Owenia fusiformis TaxID=6347 RepID=A0A8J1UZD8_OWEFU|nr:unnamed protein product [Owenia fusiformis]
MRKRSFMFWQRGSKGSLNEDESDSDQHTHSEISRTKTEQFNSGQNEPTTSMDPNDEDAVLPFDHPAMSYEQLNEHIENTIKMVEFAQKNDLYKNKAIQQNLRSAEKKLLILHGEHKETKRQMRLAATKVRAIREENENLKKIILKGEWMNYDSNEFKSTCKAFQPILYADFQKIQTKSDAIGLLTKIQERKIQLQKMECLTYQKYILFKFEGEAADMISKKHSHKKKHEKSSKKKDTEKQKSPSKDPSNPTDAADRYKYKLGKLQKMIQDKQQKLQHLEEKKKKLSDSAIMLDVEINDAESPSRGPKNRQNIQFGGFQPASQLSTNVETGPRISRRNESNEPRNVSYGPRNNMPTSSRRVPPAPPLPSAISRLNPPLIVPTHALNTDL